MDAYRLKIWVTLNLTFLGHSLLSQIYYNSPPLIGTPPCQTILSYCRGVLWWEGALYYTCCQKIVSFLGGGLSEYSVLYECDHCSAAANKHVLWPIELTAIDLLSEIWGSKMIVLELDANLMIQMISYQCLVVTIICAYFAYLNYSSH